LRNPVEGNPTSIFADSSDSEQDSLRSLNDAISRGWSVIPLSTTKRPFIDWKMYQEERADSEQVRVWLEQLDPSAWAVVTGAVSGIIVLDYDGEAGVQTMKRLGLTPHVRTPSGAYHVYVRHPGWRVPTLNGKAKQELGRVFPGMDVKGDGGYAGFLGMAKSGETMGAYTWLREPTPLDVQDVPHEVWDFLRADDADDADTGDARPVPPGAAVISADRLVSLALRKAGEGYGRDNAAFWLACQLRDAGYAEDGSTPVMLDYADQVPPTNTKGAWELFTRADALRAMRSAFTREPRNPWRVADEEASAPRPNFPLTDLGNAERLIARHGAILRYVPALGGWHTYDGTRWAKDELSDVDQRAMETVRSMYGEAGALDRDDDRHALVRFARASESRRALGAMVELASKLPGVPTLPSDFDRDPALLNVLNGTIDLRTGVLRPHRREDMLTKMVPIAYDPNATAPTWMTFLDQITRDDAELSAHLQRVTGYTLTGETLEQVLFLMHGPGANGKTTFMEMLLELGGEYGAATPADTLLTKRDGAIPNDLARLLGKRIVTIKETGAGHSLDEERVKELTGGDTISARFLYHELFDFRPQFKLMMATNYLPQVRGTDLGIWRRLQVIPFAATFIGKAQDKHLPAKLRKELPGILAWAVRGAVEWYRDGLRPPPARSLRPRPTIVPSRT
jgi:putative DNA primase/helicase